MTEPVCVISGVGPGTGSALARRFARGGYRVAMLARNGQRLNELAGQLPESKAYVCDVSDGAQVEATADKIERELGVPTVLVHNAVGGAFGSFLEIDPAVLNRNFQINTMGLLYLEHVPPQLNRGILVRRRMGESIGTDSLLGAGRCRGLIPGTCVSE